MNTIWSKKIDEILCVGRYLGPSGIRNWALSRSQALVAVEELGAAGFAVLGGDVMLQTNDEIRMTNDGWSCDSNEAEVWGDFVNRSALCAREYITRYPETGSLYFAIVPSR